MIETGAKRPLPAYSARRGYGELERCDASTNAITGLIDEKIAGGAKVEYEVLSEDAQTLLRETLELDNP
jgi:hypothetical protein